MISECFFWVTGTISFSEPFSTWEYGDPPRIGDRVVRLKFCLSSLKSCSDHILERFRYVLKSASLTILLVVSLKYTNLAPWDFGEAREMMLRYDSGSSDFWKFVHFNLHSLAEIVYYAYVHETYGLWIFGKEEQSEKNSLSDSTFSRSISLRLEWSDIKNLSSCPA